MDDNYETKGVIKDVIKDTVKYNKDLENKINICEDKHNERRVEGIQI